MDLRPAWMRAFRNLIANTPGPLDPNRVQPTFGTVRQLNPLRIALDSDPTTTLPYAPPCLDYPTAVGQRVWVQSYGRRVVIVGIVKTPPVPPEPKAWGILYKTNGFQFPNGQNIVLNTDPAHRYSQGNIGFQASGGWGEIMILKSGWYEVNASIYLTGGVGRIRCVVRRWNGSEVVSDRWVSKEHPDSSFDDQAYMTFPTYLYAGENLWLYADVTGTTNTWGDSSKKGTFLSVREL